MYPIEDVQMYIKTLMLIIKDDSQNWNQTDNDKITGLWECAPALSLKTLIVPNKILNLPMHARTRRWRKGSAQRLRVWPRGACSCCLCYWGCATSAKDSWKDGGLKKQPIVASKPKIILKKEEKIYEKTLWIIHSFSVLLNPLYFFFSVMCGLHYIIIRNY